jgi:CHAT domain-containing protein
MQLASVSLSLSLSCSFAFATRRASASSGPKGEGLLLPMVDQDGAQALEVNKLYERDLKAGETHAYQLPSAARRFIRMSVLPQGCDLRITLHAPDGRKILETTHRSDMLVQEPVAFIAETSGVYRAEVRASGAGESQGRYVLNVEEQRAATPQDKNRIPALRLFAQGAQMQFAGGQPELLRSALKKYDEALALWQAVGDRTEEARTYGSLASVHNSLGEYQKAIGFYDKACDIYRAVNDQLMESSLRENIGWLYFNSLHDGTKALQYLHEALRLNRELRDRDGEARTLALVGKVYAELGGSSEEKRRALDYFDQALVIHRDNKDRYNEGDALGGLMFAWKTLQKPSVSIFYGKQAVNTFQSVRASLKDLEKDTQKTFLKSKEDVYRTLADLLVSEGRLPEAQQVLRMLKEEEYFEFIQRDSNEAGAVASTASLTPEEAKWEKEYNSIADNLAVRGRERGELLQKSARTAEEEQRLTQLDKDLSLASQAFEEFLKRLSAELGDTKQAAKVDQFREAQGMMADLREMGSGAVALYTLVGDDKYRVILVTPDIQKAYEYPVKGADLARKVAAFREVLQNPRLDPLPLAQELYRILVGPLGKDLHGAKAETLMWSLDGVLRYIPMAALHDGQKYLVESYRNEVFTLATQTRLKDQPSPKWKALGMGVSKAQPGFMALPGVPEELRAIIHEESATGDERRGALPGKVLLDETFTDESMRVSLRQKYSVVHIASHFAFNPGNETNSFLLLGSGQHLSLADFKTSSMRFDGVELLSLSACNTATGGAGANGNEVEGFAVTAQRLGAKAVVATLWPVADASTQLLMQRFYHMRDSRERMLKVEALRQAQVSLLSGEEKPPSLDERSRGLGVALTNAGRSSNKSVGGFIRNDKIPFAHPFYWAPFILIGNWM